MLNSLEIKNYRNLKHLQIQKLGRVNLIIGKNNTGKTSVLEAVSIHHRRGDLEWVFQEILERRRENIIDEDKKNYPELFIGSLANLFYDREINNTSLEISVLNSNVENTKIKIVNYLRPPLDNTSSPNGLEGVVSMLQEMDGRWIEVPFGTRGSRLGVNVVHNGNSLLNPLESNRGFYEFIDNLRNGNSKLDNLKFIRSQDIQREDNVELWSKIALTENESRVIDVLKILEPRIQRLTFIKSENSEEQIPIIKIEGVENTWKLSSMGDGINRLLTFIIHLISCENGIFLMDEFENGLHFSTQSQLWEIIFYLVQKQNTQVFVTTHSNDSVRSFAQTLKGKQLPEDFGCLIRLENHEGNVIAREYDYATLQSATEYNIETR